MEHVLEAAGVVVTEVTLVVLARSVSDTPSCSSTSRNSSKCTDSSSTSTPLKSKITAEIMWLCHQGGGMMRRVGRDVVGRVRLPVARDGTRTVSSDDEPRCNAWDRGRQMALRPRSPVRIRDAVVEREEDEDLAVAADFAVRLARPS